MNTQNQPVNLQSELQKQQLMSQALAGQRDQALNAVAQLQVQLTILQNELLELKNSIAATAQQGLNLEQGAQS